MNDKKHYWFKRRRYGYGWIPSTWQGWTVLGTFIFIIVLGTLLLKDTPKNTVTKEVGYYLAFSAAATIGLVYISLKKGPVPKWRWGKKKEDNPDEDY